MIEIPRHGFWPFVSLFFALCILYLFHDTHHIFTYAYNTHASYSKFVSPFLEEIFRYLSIFFGLTCGLFYTLLFASVEMLNYIHNPRFANVPIGFLFFSRSICIVLHLVLFTIQVSGFRRFEKGDRMGFWMCMYLAIFLHYSWNSGIGQLVNATLFGIIQSFSPFFG